MNIKTRPHSRINLKGNYGPYMAYSIFVIFPYYRSLLLYFKGLFYELAFQFSVKVKNLRRVVNLQSSHFLKRGEGFVMSP